MTISTNFYTTNNQLLDLPHNTNFRGNPVSIPQNKHDTVEIQEKLKTEKKKGLSTNAKIGIGLGVIATVVGGLLLHKNFANKVSSEGQQVTRDFSQAVKNLINEGRISTKEAEIFDELKGLDGDEFITKAYDLLSRDMGLVKVPKLNIGHDGHIDLRGHTGKDITIYPDGFPHDNKKAEILNTLRHELEHYKQHLIVFLKKGDVAEQKAFKEQMYRRISVQAVMKDLETSDLQLLEECHRYGYTDIGTVVHGNAGQMSVKANGRIVPFSDVIKAAYEHDTPIQTIRSITPCEWERMNFSQEELAKADEYLEGIRKYASPGWMPERFFANGGHFNIQEIYGNAGASNLLSELRERYVENIIEREAIHSGETLRDKFIEFLRAINS